MFKVLAKSEDRPPVIFVAIIITIANNILCFKLSLKCYKNLHRKLLIEINGSKNTDCANSCKEFCAFPADLLLFFHNKINSYKNSYTIL